MNSVVFFVFLLCQSIWKHNGHKGCTKNTKPSVKRGKINSFALILSMRWLLFLSRLAFVCNAFFLVALSLQFVRWFQNPDAESLVIIIGYFMAMLLNPAAVLCCVLLFVRNRSKLQIVPKWLMVANALFLAFQVFYLFHLNAQ